MYDYESITREIFTQLKSETTPEPVKRWGRARLRAAMADVREIRRQSGSHDFVLGYIHREQSAYQADTPADVAWDVESAAELRDRPVCTCDRGKGCPLKRRETPRELREAATLQDGVREFRLSHPGDPVVLDEAARAWEQHVASVQDDLLEIMHVLMDGDLPEEAAPDTDADPEVSA